jgi:hypothetical protein
MSGAAALQGLGFGAFEQAAWSVPWSAGTQRLVEAISSGARGRCAQSEYDREQECCSEGVVFLVVVESVVATVAYVCLCSELVGAGRRVEYYAAQAGRQSPSKRKRAGNGWMDGSRDCTIACLCATRLAYVQVSMPITHSWILFDLHYHHLPPSLPISRSSCPLPHHTHLTHSRT